MIVPLPVMIDARAADVLREGMDKMNTLRTTIALLIGIVAVVGPAAAQTIFQNPEYEYVIDLPVSWQVVDANNPAFASFTDPNRATVLQIFAFPPERFDGATQIDAFFRQQLRVEGDREQYIFAGSDAVFADYRYETAGTVMRGYMLFLDHDRYDAAVLSLAKQDLWAAYHDVLLSQLDGFSATLAERELPGPVAYYVLATGQSSGGDTSSGEPGRELVLPSGRNVTMPEVVASDAAIEAAQVLIEREARLLTAYQPLPGQSPPVAPGAVPPWVAAWRRYFRMIYRDNFARLEPVAELVFDDLVRADHARSDYPAVLLEWLQGAEFVRTGDLSDLMSPGACLVSYSGDCDSLGLTYAILLEHLGFDAILMLSAEYEHAMVGVDVPGAGARFQFDGRDWLVAELTAEVALGQIAAEMADPAGWIGVDLDPTRP